MIRDNRASTWMLIINLVAGIACAPANAVPAAPVAEAQILTPAERAPAIATAVTTASAGSESASRGPQTPPAVSVVDWERVESTAEAKARAQHKPFLIYFSAAWCAACKELEVSTWSKQPVRDEAQRFVAANLDATDLDSPEAKRLAKKYLVRGLPTILVFDAGGAERKRIEHFVNAHDLAAALKQVR